jgi:hypothetical protein
LDLKTYGLAITFMGGQKKNIRFNIPCVFSYDLDAERFIRLGPLGPLQEREEESHCNGIGLRSDEK